MESEGIPFSQRTRNGGNGTYNEGFRDSNEITLNADVAALYSRGNNATPPGVSVASNNRTNNYDPISGWRKKY